MCHHIRRVNLITVSFLEGKMIRLLKIVIVLTQTTINEIPIVSNGTAGDTAHERSSNGLSVRCFKNVSDSTSLMYLILI